MGESSCMDFKVTRLDVQKLRLKLQKVLIGARASMELGDCRMVARLTCEAARLRNAILLARAIALEAA